MNITYIDAMVRGGTSDRADECCRLTVRHTCPHVEHGLRMAIRAYLETPEGKAHAREAGEFNWGDAVDIPARFFEPYGIISFENENPEGVFARTVEHDENFWEE